MKKMTKQPIHIPSVSAFMHAIGIDDIRHPLVEVVHLEEVRNSKDFSNIRFTTGFFAVIYKDSRCATVRYGRNVYDYDKGTLLFFAPDRLIELEDLADSYEGTMLIFAPELMQGISMSPYSFFGYTMNEALHLSERERRQFHDFVHNIESELERGIDRHSRKLIAQNVELILNYCVRFYERQFITREPLESEVMRKFNSLLDEYFHSAFAAQRGLPTVGYFANALNLSPNYFGDLVKAQAGNNPQQIIQQRLIAQACQHLTTTEHSISEIAYQLGFEYPQYFSRLFKKQTGVTPQQYRKRQQQVS